MPSFWTGYSTKGHSYVSQALKSVCFWLTVNKQKNQVLGGVGEAARLRPLLRFGGTVLAARGTGFPRLPAPRQEAVPGDRGSREGYHEDVEDLLAVSQGERRTSLGIVDGRDDTARRYCFRVDVV